MYVSVTGIKPWGLVGWIRFWMLTIPASKNAQKALYKEETDTIRKIL